jgi:predicted RNase H-like HicB family nuclease
MVRKFDIHILLYTEDHIQIAHCLEFDIVAQGEEKIEALKNLLDGIELQIGFAVENNNLASIFNPAPIEYWKMLANAKKYPYQLEEAPLFISNIDCSCEYNMGLGSCKYKDI